MSLQRVPSNAMENILVTTNFCQWQLDVLSVCVRVCVKCVCVCTYYPHVCVLALVVVNGVCVCVYVIYLWDTLYQSCTHLLILLPLLTSCCILTLILNMLYCIMYIYNYVLCCHDMLCYDSLLILRLTAFIYWTLSVMIMNDQDGTDAITLVHWTV